MYLLIPIGIFVLAMAGLAYLAGRKFVYLKKLSPEAISNPPATARSFWSGMFTEIVSWFESVNWRGYRVTITAESEKILRRLRLVFLKIDTGTHNLANRLRRSKKHHEEILQEEMVEEAVVPVVPPIDPKEEEQHLIIEIAKDAKNPDLYRKLGDVYLKTGEKENARASFETVLQLDPENWYAKSKLKMLPKKPE